MIWPFNKKKSKISIQDLAPNGLYDIHSHILCNVDDGAKNLEESIAMVEGLAKLGYKTIVATPHYNHTMFKTPNIKDVKSKTSNLSKVMSSKAISSKTMSPTAPQLLCCGEIMLQNNYSKMFEQGLFPDLAGTFLLEFVNLPGAIPNNFEDFIFNCKIKEKYIIIAHAERYREFQSNIEKLKRFTQLGAMVQIDIMSLVGKYGKDAKRTAWKLIENKQANFVATDIHSPADLSNIEEALLELAYFNKDTFISLAVTNPKYIVEGTPWNVLQDD